MHILQQVTPVLINGCNVMDFGFDPFDGRRLAVRNSSNARLRDLV